MGSGAEGGDKGSEKEVDDVEEKLVKEMKEKERVDNLWAAFKEETESSSKPESKGKVPLSFNISTVFSK